MSTLTPAWGGRKPQRPGVLWRGKDRENGPRRPGTFPTSRPFSDWGKAEGGRDIRKKEGAARSPVSSI